MRKIHNFILISLILSVLCFPFAQASTHTDQEIQHLFEFISQSDCIFIRNNSQYPAREARNHMQTKYDYAKHWVDSTEQFIERIASKSSISGNRYQVRCEGQLFYSDKWLKQELMRYRASRATGQQPTTH
jgi:hypothetical protein